MPRPRRASTRWFASWPSSGHPTTSVSMPWPPARSDPSLDRLLDSGVCGGECAYRQAHSRILDGSASRGNRRPVRLPGFSASSLVTGQVLFVTAATQLSEGASAQFQIECVLLLEHQMQTPHPRSAVTATLVSSCRARAPSGSRGDASWAPHSCAPQFGSNRPPRTCSSALADDLFLLQRLLLAHLAALRRNDALVFLAAHGPHSYRSRRRQARLRGLGGLAVAATAAAAMTAVGQRSAEVLALHTQTVFLTSFISHTTCNIFRSSRMSTAAATVGAAARCVSVHAAGVLHASPAIAALAISQPMVGITQMSSYQYLLVSRARVGHDRFDSFL